MGDGELGEEVEPGKFEGNDIPGAKDDSVAYDAARFSLDCFPLGTPKVSGPKGAVTFFKPDNQPPQTREEYGKPEVIHEGDTICVVIPKIKVVIQTGTFIVYDWYDVSCLLDNAVLLRERSREQRSQERRTILKLIKRCETDIPAWLWHKITGLISSGVSPAKILELLSGLVLAKGEGKGGDLAMAARGKDAHRLVARRHAPAKKDGKGGRGPKSRR